MGVNCLSILALCTMLSFVGLQWWMNSLLGILKLDNSIDDNVIHSRNANGALELLLSSYVSIALLANFVLNVFVLVILSLKTIFFVQLYPSETRKVVENLVNYVIYKMFQSMSKDRLERLNVSPSATPWTYFRVFSVLLLVLSIDFLWIRLCIIIYRALNSTMFLLLFFEPFSIAFETLQAIMVHGFQFLDLWHRRSVESTTDCQRSHYFDRSTVGSLWEWKGILIQNFGFFLDMMTLLMALGHYLHIWWLHGLAFHLVDAVLFLNISALVGVLLKRIKGFIKLRIVLSTLHGALPDATSEELQAYDDECAICREPMVKAKRLSCNHLFHLACLRSWLDQGLNEIYSCPNCRKPLFVGRSEVHTNSHSGEELSDEQLARLSSGLDRQNASRPALPSGPFPNQPQDHAESRSWRGVGLDSSWVQPWQSHGLDGAGPSTAIRSVRFGGVQTMMRHLASVGETYAQTALEDVVWSLWPMTHPQAVSGSSIPPAAAAVRYTGNTGGLHFRNASLSTNDNITNTLAMADTVRDVLPHISDDLIFQDLQRTNSVAVTVNNLLQM